MTNADSLVTPSAVFRLTNPGVLSSRVVRAVLFFLAAAITDAATSAGIAADEPPKFDRMFPPGGQVGTSAEVKLNGKAGTGPIQFWTERGELQAVITEAGDAATITIPPETIPVIHWCRFYNAFGTSALLPFVVGILPEAVEKEPNNKLADAQVLDLASTVVNGVLEKSGDVDTYALTLSAGQTVVVSMLAHRELNSPMDAVMQLLDARGTVLAQNDDDQGNDPQLVHQATKDGRYYVRTFAFPAAPNSTIQFAGGANYVYRITTTVGPFCDHVMPLAVESGKPSQVQFSGWNVSDEAVSIPPVGELDPAKPAPAGVVISAGLAIPVEVDLVSHPSWTESQIASNASSELRPPFSVSGVIGAARESDSLTFTGGKGQKLLCRVLARKKGSLLDPVLSVSAEDGKELKNHDDISKEDPDSLLDVTLPSDGIYRLSVTDRFAHGGPRYFYLLTVEEPVPDVELSVKESSFVMVREQALEIPLVIDRKHGFEKSLTVSAAGLPEGLTAVPVESAKDGDTAKAVTLKITGNIAAGFTGPFRITAVHTAAEGETAIVRFAMSAVDGSVSKHHQFWLTVPATPPAPAPPAASEAGVQAEIQGPRN